MKNFSTLFIFLLFLSNNAFSQNEEVPEKDMVASVAPSFWTGFPVGSFGDKIDNVAIGAGAYSLAKVKKSPFWTGASFGYLMLDREKKNIEVEVGNTDLFQKYKRRTAVKSMYLNGIVRYQPVLDSWVLPYAELHAGARRLYTRTSLHERWSSNDDDDGGGDLVDARIETEDWGFTYWAYR